MMAATGFNGFRHAPVNEFGMLVLLGRVYVNAGFLVGLQFIAGVDRYRVLCWLWNNVFFNKRNIRRVSVNHS